MARAPECGLHRAKLAAETERAKPLLRGWSHAAAVVGALAVAVALAVRTADDYPRLLSLLVYGASLVELYAVSAVYHLGVWQGRRRTLLRALDHANIFVLIAGTYTPFCVNVLSGWLRVVVLVLIWTLAVIGVAASVTTLKLPRWNYVALYLAMGWVAILPAPTVMRLLPLPATLLLIGGGLLYTVGALIYARRRPDPFPRLFGFHELFHLFVIAGSAAFLAVIWFWVVPFPRV